MVIISPILSSAVNWVLQQRNGNPSAVVGSDLSYRRHLLSVKSGQCGATGPDVSPRQMSWRKLIIWILVLFQLQSLFHISFSLFPSLISFKHCDHQTNCLLSLRQPLDEEGMPYPPWIGLQVTDLEVGVCPSSIPMPIPPHTLASPPSWGLFITQTGPLTSLLFIAMES